MNCSNCNAEIEENSLFCNKCGAKINLATVSEAKDNKPNKKKSVILIILACVILLAIILIVILSILANGKKKFNFSQIKDTAEAGQTINIDEFVVLEDESSVAVLDDGLDVLDRLGNNLIGFSIVNEDKIEPQKISVNVVDSTAPIIEGPNEINILLGQDLDLSLYSVTDFESLSFTDIVIDNSIDTSVEGTNEIELKVTDSSGNEGKKSVKVSVVGPTPVEEIIIKGMDWVNKSSISEALVFESDGTYMMHLDDNYLYYMKGIVVELKAATNLYGINYSSAKKMLDSVGEHIDVTNINYFASYLKK